MQRNFHTILRISLVFVVCTISCIILAAKTGHAATNVKMRPGDALPWPNDPPSTIPFVQSDAFNGITFTGSNAAYANADTWYPSWASDGNLYSPFMDGVTGSTQAESYLGTTGNAEIVGDDPLNLQVTALGVSSASASPYGGRYPSANLVYNGVWYYGTYTLDDLGGSCGNWCTLGPFVGFRISTDNGATWTDTTHTPDSPLFGESGKNGAKVKMGAPHFVDFGQNMQYSPDGKAYLVAHGTNIANGFENWIAGDQVYLARVTPSPSTINDMSAYEFYAGQDANGQPLWSHDFSSIQPLLNWPGQLGSTAITYDAPLHKYLMSISRPTDGFNSAGHFDTMLLESDTITGPWKLVTYMKEFGTQAYFVNIPSKFISADGRTAWLAYSANFAGNNVSNPPGSQYSLTLHQFQLISTSQSSGLTDGGTYSFKNQAGGKCLDNEASTSNGTGIWIWDCDPANQNQAWTVKSVGNGYYELVVKSSGKCLDNTNGDADNGTRLQQWDCVGNQNQAWKFVSLGNGSYQIVNQATGKCVDDTVGSSNNGNPVQIWDSVSGVPQNQSWSPTAV